MRPDERPMCRSTAWWHAAGCRRHETCVESHHVHSPLHDRVIAKRIPEEEKTKGGIIIPDNAKEKPLEGVIVAVGSGKVLDNGTVRPLEVKPGDRVLFVKYGGNEVKIDGEEHLMLCEDDILAILDR